MSVTIIMATFNRSRYIAESIASVLSQGFRDFELLVVDDGSTDDTKQILEKLSRQDERISIICHRENRGTAAACNSALAAAKYDLIVRHDDDDLMLPDRLSQQLEFLQSRPEVSVVTSWAHIIDEQGRIIGQSRPHVDLEGGLAKMDPSLFLEIVNSATMFRKNDVLAVGGYRPLMLEDRDLWGNLATSGYIIALQPRFVVAHRRHGNSVMTTKLYEGFECGDYIDFNVKRRLQGEPEVSLHEYRRLQSSLSVFDKAAVKRRRLAQVAFRRATLFYSERSWFSVAYNLAMAITLTPGATARRLWGRSCGEEL